MCQPLLNKPIIWINKIIGTKRTNIDAIRPNNSIQTPIEAFKPKSYTV
jgi:hypothetical protein